MISIKEEYGTDADGNRGVALWNYETEDSDREYIVEVIATSIIEDWAILSTYEIPFFDNVNDEIIYIEEEYSEFEDDVKIKVLEILGFENE